MARLGARQPCSIPLTSILFLSLLSVSELEDGRSRTLEEVGKEFKVTRERIPQIEAMALRRRTRSRKLKDCLE